jgi:hypothetical protein
MGPSLSTPNKIYQRDTWKVLTWVEDAHSGKSEHLENVLKYMKMIKALSKGHFGRCSRCSLFSLMSIFPSISPGGPNIKSAKEYGTRKSKKTAKSGLGWIVRFLANPVEKGVSAEGYYGS